MTALTAECMVCGERLRYVFSRGWVHHGGGTYVLRCDACHWRGSRPEGSLVSRPVYRCPRCSGVPLRDDHCAIPWGSLHAE